MTSQALVLHLLSWATNTQNLSCKFACHGIWLTLTLLVDKIHCLALTYIPPYTAIFTSLQLYSHSVRRTSENIFITYPMQMFLRTVHKSTDLRNVPENCAQIHCFTGCSNSFHIWCKPIIFFCSVVKCDVLITWKFWYKRQLARPRCHSFVNQQRTRQELVIRSP